MKRYLSLVVCSLAWNGCTNESMSGAAGRINASAIMSTNSTNDNNSSATPTAQSSNQTASTPNGEPGINAAVHDPILNNTGASSSSTVEVIVAPPAVPPVILAGAYLACSPMQAGAHCTTRNEQRELKDFGIVHAYIIKSSDLLWTETTFIKLGTGHYQVDVPTSIQGAYAIGMSTTAKENLADWIVEPSVSLVRDGSFEEHGGTLPGESVFLVPNQDSAWKTKFPGDDIRSCKSGLAYFEIVMATADEATDGNHYMDTNTSCDGMRGDTANNVVISQDVPTKAGHIYQWSYDVRKNNNAAENILATQFDARTFSPYYTSGSGAASWATHRNLVVATKDGSVMTFYDGGANPNGWGPLIDNVRLFDFGAGPQ
jgi:hypothetical protein